MHRSRYRYLSGFDKVDGATLWLRQLAVEPSYRSRGIGLSLVAKILDWGESQGAERSFLACDVEDEKAIRLYEGLGYTRASQRGQIDMVYRRRSASGSFDRQLVDKGH